MENKPIPTYDEEKAKKYSREKITHTIALTLFEILFLLVILVTGATLYFRSFAASHFSNQWKIVIAYFVIVSILGEIVSFPLSYFKGYVLEHKYGLSNQTFGKWFWDYIKGLLVGGILGIIGIETIYYVLRHYPKQWWIIAGVVFTFFTVILVRLAPVVLMPIFFKFKPLANEELKQKLENLAKESGTYVKGVFEWNLSTKTKAANAALAGLGKTRRIILADTLLENFTDDEVEVVMAHEFGHHKYAHLLKGIIIQTIAIFVGFYITDWALFYSIQDNKFGFTLLHDVANFPVIMLTISILSIIFMPVSNYIARYFERQSDCYAIKMTKKTDAFISTMERLAAMNLADKSPNLLIEAIFYSHPSIKRRIDFCKKNY